MLHISGVIAEVAGCLGFLVFLGSPWLPTSARRVIQRRSYAGVLLVVLLFAYFVDFFVK